MPSRERRRRVGITIGPQYGTVGPSFIKDAAREANRAGDLDLLCVLAFAFDPSVLGDWRRLRDLARRASPTSRPSDGSAGCRCCWSG